MAMPPGYYALRPDGLFDMSTPQGAFPTALNEDQLQGAGLQPFNPAAVPPPPMPDMQLAQNQSDAPTQSTAPPAPPPLAPDVQGTFDKTFGGKTDPLLNAPKTRILIKAAPGSAGAAPQQPGEETDPRRRELDDLVQKGVQSKLRGGPGKVVPEHQQETTGKVERKVGPSQEALEAVSDADINQQLWMQQKAEGQAEGMQAEGERRLNDLRVDDTELYADQQRRQLIDQDYAARMQDISEREARIDQMAQNPGNFVQSHGALAGIAAVVGVALGAGGAAMTHSPNFAENILDKATDDEFRAQQAAIKNARDSVEAKRWSLGEFLKAHGDPRTAELEFKLRVKDLAMKQAEAEALRSGAPAVMAAFQDWKSQRDLDRAKEMAALDASVRGEVEQNWKTIPKQTTGGGGGLLQALKYGQQLRQAGEGAFGIIPAEKQAQIDVAREAAGAKGGDAARGAFIPGEGYAYSAEEGAKLRAAKTGVDRLKDIADKSLEIRKQLAEGKINLLDAKGRLSSLQGQGAVAYKNAEQMGALDAGTQQVWGSIFGKPDEFLSIDGATANSRIRQFRDGVDSGWNSVRANQITKTPPKGGGAGPSDADAVNPPKPGSWEPDK